MANGAFSRWLAKATQDEVAKVFPTGGMTLLFSQLFEASSLCSLSLLSASPSRLAAWRSKRSLWCGWCAPTPPSQSRPTVTRRDSHPCSSSRHSHPKPLESHFPDNNKHTRLKNFPCFLNLAFLIPQPACCRKPRVWPTGWRAFLRVFSERPPPQSL